ncbi:MAG TPA: SCO family protein [Solirubrobacteraceae bacterium]|jgi:protein SCO1/2|nr:SCO family protein [Solirubrobacteraceae bacterium]
MQPRLRLALFLCGLFALTAVAAVLLFAVGDHTAQGAGFDGAVSPPNIPPEQFGLRDENGKLVELSQMRGKPVVVTFLYTHCKDTCPLTVDQIRAGLDDLGHDVPVIAVSVDPAHDTPAAAKLFTLQRHMTGRMRWVLGTYDQLQRLWRAYGVGPQTATQEHSATTILLDGSGRQRVAYETSVLTPDGLAHDLALLEHEDGATTS